MISWCECACQHFIHILRAPANSSCDNSGAKDASLSEYNHNHVPWGLIARFWVQTLTPPVSLLYSQSHLFLYCLWPALKWVLWVQRVYFHVEHPCVVKPASNITEPLSSLALLKNLSDLCALWHIVLIQAAPAWSYRSLMCMSEWVAWFSLGLWSCFLESQVE